MRIQDFDSKQLRNWKVFFLLLEQAGWEDVNNSEKLMQQGKIQAPEGSMFFWNERFELEARIYSPARLIHLRIVEPVTGLDMRLHLFYEEQPDRILEWLGEQGEHFDLNNFYDLAVDICDACDGVLLELSRDHIVPVINTRDYVLQG